MGCDIHLYTEKIVNADDTPIWWCADRFLLNEYRLYDKDDPKYLVDPIYDGRNYTLFTAIAGVRNDGVTKVISKPRGLPKDVSKVVKKAAKAWGVDGHSHSWLTAKELFDYQKKYPKTKLYGMVYGDNLKNLDEHGTPPSEWCGWTNISEAEYREWVVEKSPVDELVTAVKRRMADEFWIFDCLDEDKKQKLYDKNADKFRIVFWFDN